MKPQTMKIAEAVAAIRALDEGQLRVKDLKRNGAIALNTYFKFEPRAHEREDQVEDLLRRADAWIEWLHARYGDKHTTVRNYVSTVLRAARLVPGLTELLGSDVEALLAPLETERRLASERANQAARARRGTGTAAAPQPQPQPRSRTASTDGASDDGRSSSSSTGGTDEEDADGPQDILLDRLISIDRSLAAILADRQASSDTWEQRHKEVEQKLAAILSKAEALKATARAIALFDQRAADILLGALDTLLPQ